MSSLDQHASATPSACGTLPLALRLPDELWVTILDELEYYELLCLQSVCKRFLQLVQDKHFDAKLFRLGVEVLPEPGTKVALHPLLTLLGCVKVNESEALFYPRNNANASRYHGSQLNAYEYPAVRQFATAPACKKLEIDVYEATWGGSDDIETTTVDDPLGVTCEAALKVIATYWQHQPPVVVPAILRMMGELFGERQESFGDWCSSVVQEDGSVHLRLCRCYC